MSDASFAVIRDRLTREGRVPVGAFEPPYPELGGPAWGFLWGSLGSFESAVAGVYELIRHVGGHVRDAVVPVADSDRLDTPFVLPLLGLDGESLATFRAHGRLSFGPTQSQHSCGFPAHHFMQLQLENYFLAPEGPGLLHDNRIWSGVNSRLLNELFLGLRKLGFTYGANTWFEEANLTHVDGFGFAEVDLEWLRSVLDDRWRSVVEGRLTCEQALRELGPGGEKSSADWRLFGVKRSLEDIQELMDGVPGGDIAAARVFPWYEFAESAQSVADDNRLLATATSLRDQLAVALAPVDNALAKRIQRLPVVLGSEVAQRRSRANRIAEVQDLRNRLLRPRLATEVMQWYSQQVSLMGDALSVCHLESPTYGLDIDLSAAFELWTLGAEVQIMHDAFVIDPSSNGWMAWIRSTSYDEPQWWDS